MTRFVQKAEKDSNTSNHATHQELKHDYSISFLKLILTYYTQIKNAGRSLAQEQICHTDILTPHTYKGCAIQKSKLRMVSRIETLKFKYSCQSKDTEHIIHE